MSINNCVSDKFDLGYIDAFYDRLFVPRQFTATKILEIGVYYGASLKLWRDFFPYATVYGADVISLEFMQNQQRIVPLEMDAYNEMSIELIKRHSPEGFDIIIDDGPHTFESMEFFLKNYLSLVKSGGVLVLEDIIDKSWTPKLINCIDLYAGRISVINMTDKIKDPLLRQKWANRLDVIVVEKY